MGIWLGVLSGCGFVAPPSEQAPVTQQVRVREPHLLATPAEVGGDMGFRIAFAAAGSNVWLYSGAGPGEGPCAAVLQGGCFGILRPERIGSGVVGADGTLRLTVPIPPTVAAGDRRAFQAVVDGAPPALTQVVTRTATSSAAGRPSGNNVLIVLFDDLGTDKLAQWGSTNPAPTPTLDALAAQGVSFDHTYTKPVCGPARAAIQTGRHGRRTGVGSNWNDLEAWELGSEQITLAELVELSPYFDYQTSLAGKWHLGSPIGPTGLMHPQSQGWDWYQGSYANLFHAAGGGYQSYFRWSKVDNAGQMPLTTTYATTDTIDDAIARIGAMTEPWLLFVSLNAPHTPLEDPPVPLLPIPVDAGDGFGTRQLISAADTELARLFGAIPSDVEARTLTIVTSDNGTLGRELQEPVDRLRGKGTLFDGGVRVPMIVTGAGVTAPPGSRSAAFVDLVDVFATVAEIAGVDLSDLPSALDADRPYEIDGHSLLPLLQDPTLPGARRFAYSELFYPPGPGPWDYDRQMIRNEQYKLIVDHVGGTHRLFEYVPGATDEGPDLLGCGPLSPEHQAAYDRLWSALQNRTNRLVYDGKVYDPRIGPYPNNWPTDTGIPACTADTGAPAGDTAGP